jgi:hypothetical protein
VPSNQEEIKKRIIEALSIRAPHAICPVCKNTHWNVGDGYIVLSVSSHPTEVHMGGKVHPLVAITCSNCGNTQLINLIRLGFKPEDFQELVVSENVEHKP